jgi:hypothetical protein
MNSFSRVHGLAPSSERSSSLNSVVQISRFSSTRSMNRLRKTSMWFDLVAQRVAEHLPDARELVLPVEREHHAEEAVELGALHALAEDEDVLRQQASCFRAA